MSCVSREAGLRGTRLPAKTRLPRHERVLDFPFRTSYQLIILLLLLLLLVALVLALEQHGSCLPPRLPHALGVKLPKSVRLPCITREAGARLEGRGGPIRGGW